MPDTAVPPSCIEIDPDLSLSTWKPLPLIGPFKGFDFAAHDAQRDLRVLVSHSGKSDGRLWLHVSVTHGTRIPTYEEMAEVKRRFIGQERKAIMVFPEAEKHVNVHKRCLHLFCCLDGDPLPEFSTVSGGVRSL